MGDEPTVAEVRSWAGFKLDEIGGGSVGRVEGAYVDAKSQRVEWLLARMGRFGHHTLVPARHAVGAGQRVWVPYSRDVIRGAPRIEPGHIVTREEELGLLEHYGAGVKAAGRAEELGEGDGDAVTIRPADPPAG